ncbi:MAG TPA: hypothetical protein VJC03_06795 [bacterium]|nr:hypothetical protein [bacterium]
MLGTIALTFGYFFLLFSFNVDKTIDRFFRRQISDIRAVVVLRSAVMPEYITEENVVVDGFYSSEKALDEVPDDIKRIVDMTGKNPLSAYAVIRVKELRILDELLVRPEVEKIIYPYHLRGLWQEWHEKIKGFTFFFPYFSGFVFLLFFLMDRKISRGKRWKKITVSLFAGMVCFLLLNGRIAPELFPDYRIMLGVAVIPYFLETFLK